MRKYIFIAIAALAGFSWLLATPGPAFGQGNTWAGANLAQIIEGARWRLGALRVNASFSLSNVGYDSDVLYGYTDEPVPDYTFSASSTVQVLMPLSKKVVLDVFDSPQYVFYLDSKSERAWNNTLRSQVYFAFDRVYIQLGGGLSDVRFRLSPELNINVRQKENSLGGLVLWQVSKATSLALIYGGTSFDYGDAEFGGNSIAESQNRKESYFDFITYIQPTTRVRFFMDGQFGICTFAETTSIYKDAQSYGLFGGLEFIPRAGEQVAAVGIQGAVRLGYQRLDVIDSRFIDGSGFSGDGAVAVGFGKKNFLRVFLTRGFEFSIFSGASYYISTAYGGGISRLLSKKASLSYNISFGRSAYPASGSGGGDVPQGVHNLYTTHSFSLNIRWARHLSVSFQGSIARRIVSAGLARNRNFFGFSLVYGTVTGGMSASGGGLSR